ncbi:MAG: hypothetical protein QXX19_08335 [Candidatus Caldarchaeum sp.]
MRNELLLLLAILLLAVGIILSQSSKRPQSQDKRGGESKTLTVTVTTSSVWDRSKPLKEVDISNKPSIRNREITVYFEPQQRQLAYQVSQALSKGWQLVAKRLGIALGTFQVALIALSKADRAELGGVYIKQQVQVQQPLERLFQQPPESPQPPFPLVVPPNLRSLKEADIKVRGDVYITMPHEALHGMVNKALKNSLDRGWRFDPQTRGLEEGLAEYVGYIIAQHLDPETCRWHLERRSRDIEDVLRDREHPIYDVTQEFLSHIELRLGKESQQPSSQGPTPVELAGYGVSLAFWLQIAQQHGEGVIKEFWQRLSQKGFPNAQEAARILSELTGEDIWTKLQKMDLREVLQTLERAAGAP